MTYTILVIGSGGREHALCHALSHSPSCGTLYCSPGNAGTAMLAHNITLNNHDAVARFCIDEAVDLVVIGPEQPLVDGLSDYLRERHIAVFGPSQAAAQLEASKSFTKTLCDEANIPTAEYAVFHEEHAAREYLERCAFPIVLKADGLAAGKGVIIAQDQQEADQALHSLYGGAFGDAGHIVVIEAFLEGEEISFFALCDGTHAVAFASAQDHKAAYDGDTGPNTGGMGAYSPAPIMSDELEQAIMQRIITPAISTMAERGTPYQGILFAGLMITHNGPTLIEFNARFGDPETQVMLPRLEEDFAALCYQASQGTLPQQPLTLSQHTALCVVLAAKGYPGSYMKGSVIDGASGDTQQDNTLIFHAGTSLQDGHIVNTGGRVLGITALASSVTEAQSLAYQVIDSINWQDGFCRRDIGWRAVKREQAEDHNTAHQNVAQHAANKAAS